MYLKIIFSTVILFSIFSCNDPKANRLDTRSIREEMENRKIHRVKPVDIINQTAKSGETIIKLIDNDFVKKLKIESSSKLFEESIKNCNINLPITDSLKKVYNAKITRIPLYGKIPSHLIKKEIEMWDAYRYNLENKIPIKENSQNVEGKQMLYTTGIILSEQMCLKCHGIVGNDLSKENYKILKSNFPGIDSLVNFKKNDAIGIWSVLMDKKNIIKKVK